MNRKKLHEILDLVLDLDEQGETDAFFDFAGHVEQIAVRVYKDGWTYENEADCDMRTYLDEHVSTKNLDKIIKELKTLKEGQNDEK